jgi:hypothetical protein
MKVELRRVAAANNSLFAGCMPDAFALCISAKPRQEIIHVNAGTAAKLSQAAGSAASAVVFAGGGTRDRLREDTV